MTRKHVIYVIILYSVLFCCCLLMVTLTGEPPRKGKVQYDKEILIVDGYVIVLAKECTLGVEGSAVGVLRQGGVEWIYNSAVTKQATSEMHANYVKIYLDDRFCLNTLKIFFGENDIIVRHTSYSFTAVGTTTLNYNIKRNKGWVSRQVEERALRNNEWSLIWSEYYEEIDAANLPIILEDYAVSAFD